MDQPVPPSLAAHPDILWIIILILVFLLTSVIHGVGVIIMRGAQKTLSKVETAIAGVTLKLNEQKDTHFACREELKTAIGERIPWDDFNAHSHSENGAVIPKPRLIVKR